VLVQSLTLTADHSGGFIIGADGIELNCDGHRLVGVGRNTGVVLIGRRQVTVRNCVIEDFNNGIDAEDSAGNLIVQITVRNNRNDGVHMVRSAGHFFETIEASENGDEGFDLDNAKANVFSSSLTMRNSGNGFLNAASSSGNLVVGTSAHGNGARGFRVRLASSNNLFYSNIGCNNGAADFEENSHPNFFRANSFCNALGIRENETF
jgi:hypothetical protein